MNLALLALALVLVALGVGMIYPPCGVIAAGILLAGCVLTHEAAPAKSTTEADA